MLIEAFVGWLVSCAGSAGVSVIRRASQGTPIQRALGAVVEEAVRRTAESLAPDHAEVLVDRLTDSRTVRWPEPRLVGPDGPLAAIQGAAREWVRPLDDRLDGDERSYLDLIGVAPDELASTLATQVSFAIEQLAAGGEIALHPFALWIARDRQDQLLKRIEEVTTSTESKVDSLPRRLESGVPRPTLRPDTLPPDVRQFTGREDQLSKLADVATDGNRIVEIHAIDGMPGIGKSALAIHAAWQLKDLYPDGRLFVDLHGYTAGQVPVAPAASLERLLLSVGFTPELIPSSTEARQDLWRSWASDKHVLLVLDNARDAAQVLPLLPGTPHSLVLVTSRRRLVGLSSAVPVSLGVLDRDDALQLFHSVSRRGDPAQFAEIVDLCGHLPLAIELVAARLRFHPGWTIAEAVIDLREAQGRLDALADEVRSVRAAFELSYLAMGETEQSVFRWSALHPGPDIGEAATAALAGLSQAEARQSLIRLAEHNMLLERASTRGLDGAARRYRMHDLLRDFASELVQAEDTADERRTRVTRLLTYHVAAAAEMDAVLSGEAPRAPHATDRERAREWVVAEDANNMACVRYADLHVIRPQAAELPIALGGQLLVGGRLDDAEECYEIAERHFREMRQVRGRGIAWAGLGDVARRRGRYHRARGCYEVARQLFQRAGDSYSELVVLCGLADSLRLDLSFSAADHLLVQLRLLTRGRDELHRVRSDARLIEGELVLDKIGLVHELDLEYGFVTPDDLGIAGTHFTRALDGYSAIDDESGVGEATLGLGRVALLQGEPAEAERHFQAAGQVFARTGDRLGQATAVWWQGRLAWRTSKRRAARRLWDDALRIYNELRSPLEFEARQAIVMVTNRRLKPTHDRTGRPLAALPSRQHVSHRAGPDQPAS